MSRREVVLLVSRAIAVLQFIAALMDAFLALPQQVFMVSQAMRMRMAYGANLHTTTVVPMLLTGVAWTVLRILVLLLIGALFWKCGPAIERLLLPAGSTTEQ